MQRGRFFLMNCIDEKLMFINKNPIDDKKVFVVIEHANINTSFVTLQKVTKHVETRHIRSKLITEN